MAGSARPVSQVGYPAQATGSQSPALSVHDMKTLVIGLGNPILTDDGVGVRVAYAVQEALASKPYGDVTVTEASVGGLHLMELMVGYDRAILIDALSPSGSERSERNDPGTVQRLTLDDLRRISPTQHSASAHDTNLVTALETGRRMGFSLPRQVLIYAIQVENVSDFGERPTPAVAAAIPQVLDAVLADLAAGNGRQPPASDKEEEA